MISCGRSSIPIAPSKIPFSLLTKDYTLPKRES